MATVVAAPISRLTNATRATEVTTSRPVREAGSSLRIVQPAGLSTYPAPRMVWIMGSRPASTFLRR